MLFQEIESFPKARVIPVLSMYILRYDGCIPIG